MLRERGATVATNRTVKLSQLELDQRISNVLRSTGKGIGRRSDFLKFEKLGLAERTEISEGTMQVVFVNNAEAKIIEQEDQAYFSHEIIGKMEYGNDEKIQTEAPFEAT